MRDNQIVILQGPPCTGKTTWTKGLYMEFDKGPAIWEQKDLTWKLNEKGKYDITTLDTLTEAEYNFIRYQIDNGLTVFIDATNCNPSRVKAIQELGRELDCEVVIKTFYLPYDTVISRNKNRRNDRANYVPREAITAFYKQYYLESFRDEMKDKRKIREVESDLPNCIICDLDVTLAMHMGRGPLDYDELMTDKVDPRLRDILKTYMCNFDTQVIFITGRTDSARDLTIQWLKSKEVNLGSNWRLFTRPNHCFVPGEEFKLDIYNKHIKNKYNVICVFEDSNKCVNMFREQGLLVCQTAVTE